MSDDGKGKASIEFPYGCFALGRNISILHRFSQRFIEAELSEYNLTKAQMEVLIVTYIVEPPVNQTTLKRIFGYNKATISKLVKSLEKEGYLRREQSKVDKRENVVMLTERGYEILKVIVVVLTKEEEIFEKILGTDDDFLVRGQVHKLAEKLKDYTT